MTRVVRIDGAPGVGKTYQLRQYVEEERDAGKNLGDIYYLTFSRSGVEDAEEALINTFTGQDAEDVRRNARTFHSAALGECAKAGLIRDFDEQVISQRHDEEFYRRFCERHGLMYNGPARNHLKAMRDGEDLDAPGDKLFAINDWLTLKRYPPERYQQAPQEVIWDRETAVDLLEAWDGYKRNYGVRRFEHGDYVDAAIEDGLVPDKDVLFIDEFQDLAPQEYKLYKTWRDSGELDRIYIAGDPNQSIYSFRAGTPLYFEETDVDETEVLKESYRCPAEIASVARAILRETPYTDPRGFTGRDTGGTVERYIAEDAGTVRTLVEDAAQRYDDVMILARANYQVSALAKCLRGSNVPFSYLGRRSGVWDGDLSQIYTLLRKLREGVETVPKKPVNKLLAAAPRGADRRSRLGSPSRGQYDAKAVWRAFGEYDDVEEIATSLDLSADDSDLLLSAISGGVDTAPEDLRLGTIHGAKGLEADCVLLFDGYTYQLENAYEEDQEVQAEEHRLYYVGATRASEELRITTDFFDRPAPPLGVVR